MIEGDIEGDRPSIISSLDMIVPTLPAGDGSSLLQSSTRNCCSRSNGISILIFIFLQWESDIVTKGKSQSEQNVSHLTGLLVTLGNGSLKIFFCFYLHFNPLINTPRSMPIDDEGGAEAARRNKGGRWRVRQIFGRRNGGYHPLVRHIPCRRHQEQAAGKKERRGDNDNLEAFL